MLSKVDSPVKCVYIAEDTEDRAHTMTKGKSNELEGTDFNGLTEEMEDAMAQARKAMEDLYPLEELSGIQEAMAGLARMGRVVEKMRLAAEKHEQFIAELVGEPDWRMEAEIEVRKGPSSLMKVELTADFDLEIIVQAHEIASSDEGQTRIATMLRGMGLDLEMVQEQVARGRGMALIRELNLVEPAVNSASPQESQGLRLTPEANVPLKISNERELCFEFAPALRNSVPRDDPAWEEADLPDFAPTIEEVRVSLDSFEPGEPFQRSMMVSQEELELEFKLAFRPL
jgi:hypothetical protein